MPKSTNLGRDSSLVVDKARGKRIQTSWAAPQIKYRRFRVKLPEDYALLKMIHKFNI